MDLSKKCNIYKLFNPDPAVDKYYIGISSCILSRTRCHRTRCYNKNDLKRYNSTLYTYIRANGGFSEWKIEIMEEYSPVDKDDMYHRERLYIQVFQKHLLNSTLPIRTKEEVALYKKFQSKNYDYDSIHCGICESTVMYKNIAAHKKTTKHLTKLSKLIDDKDKLINIINNN